MPVKHMHRLLKDKRRLLLVGLIAVLAVVAALNWMWGGLGGGGGGGGGGTNTTTTTSPGGGGGGGTTTTTIPPGDFLYPNDDVKNGFNVIFIEDHVAVEGDHFKVVARLSGSFRSLVAYGGSSVTGNITYGSAYIKYNYYTIPIIGFASTNATITQDFPGIQVRLREDGGYVIYTPVSMAIYYQRYVFNLSNTVVYVWVPARTLPGVLSTEATMHVYIDPENCFYYVNGQPYRLSIDAPPRRLYRGVLRSWVIYADRYGTYVFQVNP